MGIDTYEGVKILNERKTSYSSYLFPNFDIVHLLNLE